MTFRVETTAQAERDGAAILESLLAQHAGESGFRWFLTLEEAIASLATFPKRCPIAPENERFPFEVRQMLYGRKPHVYRILFTIDKDTSICLYMFCTSGTVTVGASAITDRVGRVSVSPPQRSPRLCGPLAKRRHHKPDSARQPDSRLEAAHHKAYQASPLI